MNQLQMGLMFCEESATGMMEHPVGYFLDPQFTGAELRERFAVAQGRLLSLAGPVRPLMREGLERAEAELKKQMEHLNHPTTPIDLWRVRWVLDLADVTAFIEHVQIHSKGPLAGFEYRIEPGRMAAEYLMYVEGIGSLSAVRWLASDDDAPTVSLYFMPWRDAAFKKRLKSSQQRRIACPASVWRKAYAAVKLAEAGDKPASVQPFTHEGREYVNDGMMSHGSYAECGAWSFVRLEDWQGPTYSYRSQGAAWDDGRLQRGDRRGLVVTIRGRACVLDDEVIFFDENVPRQPAYFAEEEDDIEDNLIEGEEAESMAV